MKSKNVSRPTAAQAFALFVGAFALMFTGGNAWGQEDDSVETDEAEASDVVEEADPSLIEEITVVGSRVRGRTETESPVPVDIIDGEDFASQGSSDLDSLVANLVPSYNISQEPISDAATIMRPANLRGLSPDSTLVLVNGKRRHRGAVITLLGSGISGGAQAPDLASIPGIAIGRLEVLRDGASAQYGSDAIAGILNFVLKDDNAGASIELKTGTTFEGDGAEQVLAASFPLALGDNGWIHVSGEYRTIGATDRAVQRGDAQDLIDAGNGFVRQPHAMIWGGPDVKGDIKIFANAGFDISPDSEVYGWMNRSVRNVEGGFYYRNPNTRNGVFNGPDGLSFDPATNLVVAAGTPGSSTWASTVKVANLDPSRGGCGPNTVQNSATSASYAEQVDDADYTSIIAALPQHCFMFQEVQPGGFTPQFGGDVTDLSFAAGIRGVHGSGWFWDASVVRGSSEAIYFINNTVNPQVWARIYDSGGDPATVPLDYLPGTYLETDIVFNADVSKPLDIDAFYGELNLAAGFEYRSETFEIIAGEDDSWYIDPSPTGLTSQGYGIGCNGFAGFPAGDAGENSITAWSLYGDLEGDLTETFKLGGALRYEAYDLFGSTLNWKLTGRLAVSDELAVRGAFSTGFRVPTGGQANLRNVTTEFTDGKLADIATLPPTNPVAQQKGAKDLVPETSNNLTLGIIWSIDAADITFDFYRIVIEDRIAFTSRFTLTPADIQALLAAGVPDATSFSSVRYFSNQQDLETRGVDLVVSYPFNLAGGNSELTFASNWNSNEVTRFDSSTSAHLIKVIQEGRPASRFTVTLTHAINKFSGLVRLRQYGEHYDSTLNDATVSWVTDPSTLFDFEVGYDLADEITVVFGLENALDTYPPTNPTEGAAVDSRGAGGASGLPYPEQSPFGFYGGFYYLRLAWRP